MRVLRFLSILLFGCTAGLLAGCGGEADEVEQETGIQQAEESAEYQQYRNLGGGGGQGHSAPGGGSAGGPGGGHGR